MSFARPAMASLTALLLALAIYGCYRPAGTNVNLLLSSLLPEGAWQTVRLTAQQELHLAGFLRDALPGGLWVFAATLMAQGLAVPLGRLRLNLEHLPLCTALFFEGLQWLRVTDGRFDPADMGAELLGWFTARLWLTAGQQSRPAMAWRLVLCAASYAILPLADVHR